MLTTFDQSLDGVAVAEPRDLLFVDVKRRRVTIENDADLIPLADWFCGVLGWLLFE